MAEEKVWSYFWDCTGEFGAFADPNKPQKCPCGGNINCNDREKHIANYIKGKQK